LLAALIWPPPPQSVCLTLTFLVGLYLSVYLMQPHPPPQHSCTHLGFHYNPYHPSHTIIYLLPALQGHLLESRNLEQCPADIRWSASIWWTHCSDTPGTFQMVLEISVLAL
jgi:hypothetical protein